jgi:hypothetical protein
MAPSLKILEEAMKKAGFEGSVAFKQILRMSELATDGISGPLIDSINSGVSAIVSMSNSGFLTQETFEGLWSQIMANRQALIDNGATEEEVNRLIAPSLQRIWELREDGKLEVDDTTAALLDQLEAQGLVGDGFRSATDRMVLALERLADMFETVFAEKLADAAKRGAQEANNHLAGIHIPERRIIPEPSRGSLGLGEGIAVGPGTYNSIGADSLGSGGGGTNSLIGGDQTIVVQVGEEVLVRKVVRGMPKYLKLIGAQ